MTDETASDTYSFHPDRIHGTPSSNAERERREGYLDRLRSLLKLDADEYLADPRVSLEDESWADWQARTGELPPDFEHMPAVADLPDPLRREENGEWTTVTSAATWDKQRDRLTEQLQYWLYGEFPPRPDNLRSEVVGTQPAENATVEDVHLEFGPGYDAELHLQVMTPDGTGPFPVFMTQWNHRKWALLALQRGYMAVIYAGADACDDAADYREQYPGYDFQLLARRAWASHRAIDYLETRPDADCDRVGITGASRNGKQSLIAAAFDERIDAVVPCSAGSGGVVPARFDRDDFHAGDMSLHARLRRSWFHPRWRFFVGRENRLPVDANSLVSLVAPRACMLHTALNERTTSAWAVDRVYESATSVYDLLDAGDNIALRYRQGRHARTTRDVQHIIDFFDDAFDRGDFDEPSQRYHEFSFEEWATNATADVDVQSYPKRGLDDILTSSGGDAITTVDVWEAHAATVQDRIRWGLGEQPARASEPSASSYDTIEQRPGREDFTNDVIGRPEATATRGKLRISPSEAYGERVGGDLYYPTEESEDHPNGELPVVLWLHPYAYNTGYGAAHRGQVPIEAATDRGFALYGFDQLGFGTRVIEGENFYDQYPNWSKMGKLVEDTLAAVETLSALEFVDSDRVFVLGYSLGATVGLYAAALDERVNGVASVCGFSPFRLSNESKEREHAVISRLSHLHGLQPRLGLFRDDPSRVPFDFHEVLGLIAPRPLLTVAPQLDWTHPQEDVERCVEAARRVYDLYGSGDRLDLRTPEDHLSFDYHEARLYDASDPAASALRPTRRDAVFDWLESASGHTS